MSVSVDNNTSNKIDISYAERRDEFEFETESGTTSSSPDSYQPSQEKTGLEKWFAGETSITESIWGEGHGWAVNALGATVEAPLKVVTGAALVGLAIPSLVFGAGCTPHNDDTNTPDPKQTPPKDDDADGYYTCESYTDNGDYEQCLDELVSLHDGEAKGAEVYSATEINSMIDCDDANASIHPQASESCNGIDDDCNGEVDDDPVDPIEGWLDADEDGFGDPTMHDAQCTLDAGYVVNPNDCDDTDATIHPTATELCDGIDNNCDDLTDDDDPAITGQATWYNDADSDSFGNPLDYILACTAYGSYTATDSTDCDDTDPFINPWATEVCDDVDNDCDTNIDEGLTTYTWYQDADSDGYGNASSSLESCHTEYTGYVSTSTDCDDTDPAVNPGETEVCGNTTDENCDGITDCDVDNDGDGFFISDGDCNDSDASINPAATEVCDGVDNDCDSTVDESDALGAATWYLDADSDGYGVTGSTQVACTVPSGYSAVDGDCNDSNASISPSATELCDGADNDCDGLTDEDDPSVIGTTTYYEDNDSDGYGDPTLYDAQCTMHAGYVSNPNDCDDTDGAVYPGAEETCNGIDDDCSGVVDDGLPSYTLYHDADSDTYGDPSDSMTSCYSSYASHVTDATDCDDADATINPAAGEYCDYADNDCDGTVDNDNALDADIWYLDADSDGYGVSTSTTTACFTPPAGYSEYDTDCNDAEALANPGLTEICKDGIDNDCSGNAPECVLEDMSLADADRILEGSTAYAALGYSVAGLGDLDGDGYEDYAIGRPDLSLASAGRTNVVFSDADGYASYDALYGVNPGDLAGYSVAGVGDVDGDGVDDVLVGAPYEGSNGVNAGAAYLVLGPDVATATLDTIAESVMYGDAAYDGAGVSVVGAGDVDNDGFDDFLVGASGYGLGYGAGYGAAGLIYGPISTDIDLSTADAFIQGAVSGYETGWGLSGGNVNGDSYSDVLIGSYGANKAHIFYGPVATGTTTTASNDIEINGDPTNGEALGDVGTMKGDIDADGYNDIVLCDPYDDTTDTDAGACYLFYGDSSLPSSLTAGTDEDTRWLGPEQGAYLGVSVIVADVNGDGFDDVIIGVNGGGGIDPYSTFIGSAYLYYGPVSSGDLYIENADAELQGEVQGDLAGSAVGAGDFNGDGFGDVIVGAPYSDRAATNGGAAYLVFGTGM